MNKCPVCQGPETDPRRKGNPGACNRCHRLRYVLQKRAHLSICALRRCGLIDPPGSRACVDCGKPAQVYDHRSYFEPLVVDAVCSSCNKRRGATVEFAPGTVEHITLEAA